MDDTSAFMRLHLKHTEEEDEEEMMAILKNPISNYNSSYWSANPAHLTSTSTFTMDNIAPPPFITAPNIPLHVNEIQNFPVFSHLRSPTLSPYSHLPPDYNSYTATPEMAFIVTSTSATNYGAVEKMTELLNTVPQLADGVFPQMGSHHQALNIGLEPNFSCFSPWVAPKQGGIAMMAATPTKGQLLLKKCLLEMLPWMRHVNNPMKHGGRGDFGLTSQVALSNPNNNAVMAYNNDAMLMYGKCSYTTTIRIGQQDGATRHHLLAERTRRQTHSECLKALQVLLPKNPKKDKVSILNFAIEQIKELKDCNKDLENRIKELHSTTLALKSRWVSSSSSSKHYVGGGGGYMSTNIDIHEPSFISSTGMIVVPSPNAVITSSYQPNNQYDLHHGTTSISSTSVSINTALQSDHSIVMHVLASARLTLGSNQLIKVLMCLKDLGLEVLSIRSTFEGDLFMAEISARAKKGSSLDENQIKDSLVKAL